MSLILHFGLGNWLLVGTGLIAVCALLLSLSSGYRLRVLTATIATLQLTIRAHATPIKLNFFTTTLTAYTNQSALTTLQIKYTLDTLYEIIVVSLLTMSVIFTIWIFEDYIKKVAYKFDLSLCTSARTNTFVLFGFALLH